MPEVTGWLFTDAVSFVGCPKCDAEVERSCRSPSGRKKYPPHKSRLDKFREERPEEWEAHIRFVPDANAAQQFQQIVDPPNVP